MVEKTVTTKLIDRYPLASGIGMALLIVIFAGIFVPIFGHFLRWYDAWLDGVFQ